MRKNGNKNKLNNAVRIFLSFLSVLLIFVYTKPMVVLADGNDGEQTVNDVFYSDSDITNNELPESVIDGTASVRTEENGVVSDETAEEPEAKESGVESAGNEDTGESEANEDTEEFEANENTEESGINENAEDSGENEAVSAGEEPGQNENSEISEKTEIIDDISVSEETGEKTEASEVIEITEIIEKTGTTEKTETVVEKSETSAKKTLKGSSQTTGTAVKLQDLSQYDLVYSSDDQVIRGIRDMMVQRRTNFTIYVASEYYDWNSLGKLFQEWFEAARNHSINDNSSIEGFPAGVDYAAGDYLEWTYSGYRFSYSSAGVIKATVNYYTNAEQEAYATERIAQILSELNLDGMSDYEKTKCIYEYICNHVSYDYDRLEDDEYVLKYTAYNALHDGNAVCQGYATLLYRMLNLSGIESRVVTGITGTQQDGHAWNIVKVDGVWYNVDVTFDAETSTQTKYFLRTDEFFSSKEGGYHELDEEFKSDSFRSEYPVSTEDNPYELKGVKPKYISVSLGGEIILNYYLEITDETILNSDDAYVLFTLPGNEQKIVSMKDRRVASLSSGGRFYIYSCSISASQMNENVSVEVVYGGKSSPRARYSVRYYVDRVLKNENESSEAKNAARALLNYGAYSRAYFGQDGDSSFTGLDHEVEEKRAQLTDYDSIAPEFSAPEKEDPDDINYYGTSMLLKSRITLRHYFRREGKTIDEIKQNYTFKINGAVCEPVLKGNYVYIQLENIAAHELGQLSTVTVENAGRQIVSFSFSPMTYSRTILENNDGIYREELKNLSMALYLYYIYSQDYKSSGSSYIYGS